MPKKTGVPTVIWLKKDKKKCSQCGREMKEESKMVICRICIVTNVCVEMDDLETIIAEAKEELKQLTRVLEKELCNE